jgi:Spondin_N
MLKLGLLLVATIALSAADIVFENEEIKAEEIYDLDYARASEVSVYDVINTTSYYCVFRSNWNVENHPANFPDVPRWGNPLMFSHTKQYAPYIKNRPAPNGVELIAEVSSLSLAQSRHTMFGEAYERCCSAVTHTFTF